MGADDGIQAGRIRDAGGATGSADYKKSNENEETAEVLDTPFLLSLFGLNEYKAKLGSLVPREVRRRRLTA